MGVHCTTHKENSAAASLCPTPVCEQGLRQPQQEALQQASNSMGAGTRGQQAQRTCKQQQPHQHPTRSVRIITQHSCCPELHGALHASTSGCRSVFACSKLNGESGDNLGCLMALLDPSCEHLPRCAASIPYACRTSYGHKLAMDATADAPDLPPPPPTPTCCCRQPVHQLWRGVVLEDALCGDATASHQRSAGGQHQLRARVHSALAAAQRLQNIHAQLSAYLDGLQTEDVRW